MKGVLAHHKDLALLFPPGLSTTLRGPAQLHTNGTKSCVHPSGGGWAFSPALSLGSHPVIRCVDTFPTLAKVRAMWGLGVRALDRLSPDLTLLVHR